MGRFISDDTREALRSVAGLASMGAAFGISIGIGVVLGGWVDGKYHTGPWGFFIGLAVGMAAGMRSVFIMYRRYTKKD